MPRDLELPTKFDRTVSPKTKREWFAWSEGKRPHSWWWHVAYVVRLKRVRHTDAEKIKRIMRLIDQKLPHLKEDYVRGTRNASHPLPSYERIFRGEVGGYVGTTRRG